MVILSAWTGLNFTEASGIANVATQRIEQGKVEETTDSRKAKQSWVHVLNPGCLVKNRKKIILRRTSSGTKKNPSPFQHHVGICAKWRDGCRAIDCLIGLRRLSQNSAGIAARSGTARISDAGKAKGKKCRAFAVSLQCNICISLTIAFAWLHE